MRKTIFSTLKLAAFAALLCAGCTDIGDEGMHGDENKRRAADSFLGLYTVTFSSTNYGYGTVPAAMTVIPGDSVKLPAEGNMRRDGGYGFGGWGTNRDGSGTNYAAGSSYKPNGNVTLYVKWIRRYTVMFSAGDGTGTVPASITVDSGSSITLPSGDGLTRFGYYFDGWNISYDAYSARWANYAADSSYTPTDRSGSVSLAIANWVSQYRVEFSASGGTGTVPASMWVMPGDSVTLPSGDGLTRSGYYFDGWYYNGTNYAVGSSYKPTSTSVILYVKWIPQYTVTFNVNGGSGGGTIPAFITVDSGSTLTLPLGDSLTKSGYRFDGWHYNGTDYAAGSSYRPYGNPTMFARWIRQYTVTFNANGGTETVPAAITADSASTVTLPYGSGLTRSGYRFDGWNTSYNGQGTNFAANSLLYIAGVGSITLYAKWTEE